MKTTLLTLFILFFQNSKSLARDHSFCDEALTGNFYDLNHTQQFTSYLAELFDQGVFTGNDLKTFFLSLRHTKKITNPFGALKNHTDSARLTHSENLQNYIDHADLDYNQVLNWTQSLLESTKQKQLIKQDTAKKTEVALVSMKFYPIKARSFSIKTYNNKTVTVTLTNDFEMMNTPVTQAMWLQLMKYNPANWKGGSYSLDNPIENITWWSAAEFANRLSEKMGYEKVYDFSNVIFDPSTSAEKGDLKYISGEIKVQGNNIYQTRGFRLPTLAEQKLTSNYLVQESGVNEDNVIDYAWSIQNSGWEPHPVMEKRAIAIDGNYFFDLVGNVGQWSNDDHHNITADSTDPIGPFGLNRILVGGDFHSAKDHAFSKSHTTLMANEAQADTGFRLVRSLPKKITKPY